MAFFFLCYPVEMGLRVKTCPRGQSFVGIYVLATIYSALMFYGGIQGKLHARRKDVDLQKLKIGPQQVWSQELMKGQRAWPAADLEL
ncbi:hypothetical protein PoB_005214600 [Plakobranchus ocellatus]|uniref:Uncharacterized protein n=1 Tax=Plakobranchus ocellatus TaxID=259542 RepID=A0AAV4BYM7_9GAST|nr:hypothetical protein PoB_005214600 [Plakobranchus ocellatus]